MIRRYTVTDASVHNGRVLDEVFDEENSGRSIWAGSACRSKEREAELKEKGYRSRIHHKGHRNRKLNPQEQRSNRSRSKARARVEHIFGYQHMFHGGGFRVRVKGKVRAAARIGLMNLVYNMRRLEHLLRGSSAWMAG